MLLALESLMLAVVIHTTVSAIDLESFKWDYARNGPRSWRRIYPDCSKERQSPINIDSSSAWYSRKLTAFDWQGYESIPKFTHWEMWNIGTGVRIEIQGDYRLSDGDLPGVYRISYMDIHWGGANTRGSEHMIDDEVFPMELQLVHFKMEYGSIGEASKHEDGLVILAFLFKAVKETNLGLVQITENLRNISHKGDHLPLRPLPLLSMLPQDLNDYYRYKGSMTTPPCTQTVSWTVFKQYVQVSEKQLKKFRQFIKSNSGLEQDVPLVDNFRPPQPLNGRTVYSSDRKDATIWSSPLGSPISITLAVFLGFMVVFVFVR